MDLLIRSARKIFFLGFGYDQQNLEILRIPERFKGSLLRPIILGTAKGQLKEEIDKIKLRFLSRVDAALAITIEDCDCAKLLRKYLVE